MQKLLAFVAATSVLTLTAACGGDGRPSAGELSDALTSEDSVFGTAFPERSADCVAEVLVDSDLSDDTLNAIVEGDEEYEGDSDEQAALQGLSGDIAECLTLE